MKQSNRKLRTLVGAAMLSALSYKSLRPILKGRETT